MSEGGIGGAEGTRQKSPPGGLRPPAIGSDDPFWPTGVALPGASFSQSEVQRRNDPQLQDAIAKVLLYLQVQRDIYYPLGHPLSETQYHELNRFFCSALLDRIRVV